MQSMKALIVLAATASAFVTPRSSGSSAATARFEVANPSAADTQAFNDLVALQNTIPGPPGFYDPLELASQEFSLGIADNDQDRTQAETIGFLRHSEIKHGRVAMAAFLGFIAQCTPLVRGEHKFLPYSDYVAGVTPQEQWDNIPLYGKLQIVTFVGMLESYGEGAGQPDGYVHYMKGGKPGFFPEIYGRGGPGIEGRGAGRHFVLNLWDPLNWAKSGTAEDKARGLKCEILNGRAAMFGIMGLLAESSTPGSVPLISGIQGFPRYAGNVMVPFSNDFTLAGSLAGGDTVASGSSVAAAVSAVVETVADAL